MNVSRSLTFLWTTGTLIASVAVVLVTAVLCFVAWRRSGFRRSVGFLEALRLGCVAIVAVMLNQPEWVEEYRPDEKPSVVVLYDASPSMDTRDVVPTSGSNSTPITRREAVGSAHGIGGLEQAPRTNEYRDHAVFKGPGGTRNRP